MIPEIPVTSNVPEENEDTPVLTAAEDEKAEVLPDFSGKSLAELAGLFEELAGKEDRMKRYKEAEAIKSAFYKRLLKEKADAGLAADVREPDGRLPEEDTQEADGAAETAGVEPAGAEVSENPFNEIERGVKVLYNRYKKERAEDNRHLEKAR